MPTNPLIDISNRIARNTNTATIETPTFEEHDHKFVSGLIQRGHEHFVKLDSSGSLVPRFRVKANTDSGYITFVCASRMVLAYDMKEKRPLTVGDAELIIGTFRQEDKGDVLEINSLLITPKYRGKRLFSTFFDSFQSLAHRLGKKGFQTGSTQTPEAKRAYISIMDRMEEDSDGQIKDALYRRRRVDYPIYRGSPGKYHYLMDGEPHDVYTKGSSYDGAVVYLAKS